MPQYRIMIARFPYGGVESKECTDWLIKTVMQIKADPLIADPVDMISLNDTPITMTRNLACRLALERKADFLLMLDSDMDPDLRIPGARPFWETSFPFLAHREVPAMIAAPYCGPPPVENIYVFRWRAPNSDHVGTQYSLQQFTREEAAERIGIEEVAALPTGLMLMDTRVLKHVSKPWFDYEYSDQYESEKSTTEDVYFTRNASMSGCPVYCNWDSWAGHLKKKSVGKPVLLTADLFSENVRKARMQGKDSNMKFTEIQRKRIS